MKLKLSGDGSYSGTNLVTANDELVAGVSNIKFTISPSNPIRVQFDVEARHMDFEIKTGQKYSPNLTQGGFKGRSEIKLKLAGDGTAFNSAIYDAETDELIENIELIEWDSAVVHISIIDVDIDLSRKQGSSSGSGSTGSVTISPSASYSNVNPYNPYAVGNPSYQAPTHQNYQTCGAPPPSQDPCDAVGQKQFNFDSDASVPASCSHEWINASFVGIKMVCKYCNKEK